jgi:hypothetical protein
MSKRRLQTGARSPKQLLQNGALCAAHNHVKPSADA